MDSETVEEIKRHLAMVAEALRSAIRTVAAVLAAAMLAAATAAETPAASSRLPLAPCTSERLKGALCGTLSVPEDPDPPERRTIQLNVPVLPALEPRAGAGPVCHLGGGRGVAAWGAAEFYLGPGSLYRRSRDVVLVDQRGTGGSGPLRCPTLEQRSPLEDYEPVGAVAACRRALEAQADLTKYSTSIASFDLDRVRAALGYDRVDLWALSYGTRLAQGYLKAFPSRVRSAVLMGFAPLDYKAPLFHAVAAQRVLDLVLDACQLDAPCAARYPDLRRQWRSLLARLEAGPVVASPSPGATTMEIRREPFGEALRTMLGTAAGQRRLPAIIHRAAQGDFSPFLAMVPKGPPGAEGLYLTIACSEAGARITDEEARRHTAGTFLGDYRVARERAACSAWRTYAVPESFYVPPSGGVPLLVISGEMDHVTPPAWAEAFCAAIDSCTLLRIPALGHGPFDLDEWTHGECLDAVTQAFYEHPGRVDADCLRGLKPPPFQ
jgi:pimeloyl-ACP methyl ester carboxylesterase